MKGFYFDYEGKLVYCNGYYKCQVNDSIEKGYYINASNEKLLYCDENNECQNINPVQGYYINYKNELIYCDEKEICEDMYSILNTYYISYDEKLIHCLHYYNNGNTYCELTSGKGNYCIDNYYYYCDGDGNCNKRKVNSTGYYILVNGGFLGVFIMIIVIVNVKVHII